MKAGLAGQRQRQASDDRITVGSAAASAKRRRLADTQEHISEGVNIELVDPLLC